MKINVDGILREETQEEIEARKDEQARYEAEERKRELTDSEVMDMFLTQHIQEIQVNDTTALRMKSRYPKWEKLIGNVLPTNFKFTYQGELWKVRQSHMAQEQFKPSIETASLYERIEEKHLGNKYDAIPYSGNMTLEQGKYYTQDNELYYCHTGSGIAVFNKLSELIVFVRKEA